MLNYVYPQPLYVPSCSLSAIENALGHVVGSDSELGQSWAQGEMSQ